MTELPGQTDLFVDVPHARTSDPDTSHAAAAALTATPRAGTMRTALLRVYAMHAVFGLTAEEAAHRAGYTPADGAWKRVSDLEGNGWVMDTGIRRVSARGRSARVLAITDRGMAALRAVLEP